MNSYKIKLACVAMFAVVAASANAQSADSTSSANTSSSSTGIGMGGGSSLNNIGTNSTSSATTNSSSTSVGGLGVATAAGGAVRNSGNSSSSSGVRSSGNSSNSVSVNVQLAQAGNGTGTDSGTASTGKAAVGDPGSSPYNTNSRVEYAGSQTVKTNPTIGAPSLTTTLSDTCMGSVSVGLSLPGFGATGGTTLVDQACVRRLDAREFRAMGLTDVALALLCQSDSNRRAVEATGHLCPGTTQPLAKAQASAQTPYMTDDEKYHDPITRARLGLPPMGDPYTKQQADAEKNAAPVVVRKSVETAPTATAPVASPAPAAAAKEDTADTGAPIDVQPVKVAVLH